MDQLSPHIWIGFSGGILSFAHCIGMCGGFLLHLSKDRQPRRALRLQGMWHLGRIAAYTLAGTAAGLAGQRLAPVLPAIPYIQNSLGLLAGLVMILAGLSLLGLVPVKRHASTLLTGMADSLRPTLSAAPPSAAALLLGMLAGLLPCPVVLAGISYALQTSSPLAGMTAMGALGIGSALPLLLVGAAGRWMQLRDWGAAAGGIILILLGAGTALRGTGLYHHLLGCPPSFHTSGEIASGKPPNSTPTHAPRLPR